jgi:hypothetical protein
MQRLKTALIVASITLGIALVTKDIVLREVFGIVELRRDPNTLSYSDMLQFVLGVMLMACGLAWTIVNARIKRAQVEILPDAEPVAKE